MAGDANLKTDTPLDPNDLDLRRYWGILGGAYIACLAVTGIALIQAETARAPDAGLQSLVFVSNVFAAAFETLTALMVVALFLERANEVFIKSTRTVKRTLAEREIKSLLDDPDQAAALKAAKDRLTCYRAGTRLLTIAFSTTLGTLIALAGVRALSPLFEAPYDQIAGWQWALLHFMDALTTVALVSGGAGGIHKLLSVIGDRMESGSSLETETRPD